MKLARQKPDIAAALREAIVRGQFMPNERLIETELATRFATNRPQIRAAFGVLEQEGLIVSEQNRGARVRLVTAAEAIEITEARAALETLVATIAARRATPSDIETLEAILGEMRAANALGDLVGYSSLNGRLHAEIRRIARHATASKLLTTLNSQSVRFQFRAILIPGRAAKSLKEHEAIVEAIRQHDPERTRAVTAEHFTQVVEALRQAIAASGETPVE